ncbi:hypothetical protein EV178_005082 [Coemansia sp. RSA 1646]|nr:hypothetical protein EV178_005082 [Coemansia sp. RSA 1646]
MGRQRKAVNDEQRHTSVVSLESDDIPSVDAVILGYDKASVSDNSYLQDKPPANDDVSVDSPPNEQQQNDIIAMFSDDEDNHSAKEITASYQKSPSQGTTAEVSAREPAIIHDFGDDGSSSASHMGFIDEESARNYQRILANKSDSEVGDEPGVLDKRRIIGHRLRSSARPKRTLLSRYEQARLRAQHSIGNSEPENSDLDQDAIKDAQGIVDDGYTSRIDHFRKNDREKVDMPDTDSETERIPRKSVLVIHDSSEEGDSDFISETEEFYPAKKQPATNAKLEKFLSVFEPNRRKQMHQKLETKNGLGRKSGSLNPDVAGSPQHRPAKIARGYSDELDDDLADFIVDEEENAGEDESGSDIANGSSRHVVSIDNHKPNIEVLSDGDLLSDSDPDQSEREAVMAQMPEQFSQFDLPTSFKTYVQYLVYWLCNGRHKPELSNKNARYFFFAYITIARVIDSVEQSLVESSAWVDSFRRDLHSYPEIHLSRIAAIEGCDACHFRKNRTATFCLGLLGKPYDREVLIPPHPGEYPTLSFDDTQDSSQDNLMVVSDDEDSDFETGFLQRKHSVVEYNVGRTCKQRAETGHELHHYFYHLAYLVEISLSTLSFHGESNDGEWIHKEPEDLVEMLDGQGMVDKLFTNFKDLLSRSKSGFAS